MNGKKISKFRQRLHLHIPAVKLPLYKIKNIPGLKRAAACLSRTKKRIVQAPVFRKKPFMRIYAMRTYCVLVGLLVVVSMTGFIDRGKSVTLVADGTTTKIYTRAINEKALLREANVQLGQYDEVDVSTQKLDDGSYVKVRRAVPVTLEYKGQSQQVYSAKHNSQEVAEQYGYSKEKYRPHGDVRAPLKAGQHIVIGRVSRKTITEDDVVPYAIESIPDETLGQGEEKIVQEGQNGRKKVTLNLVSVDGKLEDKETVSTELVSEMKPLVRKVGTKVAAVEVNTNGQVSQYKAVMTMEATAYLPTDGDGQCITRMGTRARYGVVAVDPNVIPLGTKVFIPGYGVARAEDTGGAILGNRIDLCMEDYDACMAFGRRTVPVYILQ